jgi:hypothetical protein
MFGLKNFTGFTFVAKLGNSSWAFAAGMVEEVTFNITAAGAANAAEIPENFNLKLDAKEKLLATASAGVGSKIGTSNLLSLIAGATPNLLI